MNQGPIEIMIPKTSVAVSEGKLVEWLAGDNEQVAEGQPLYVLETDKVEIEVEAPVSGTFRTAGVPGTTYTVGTVIAWLWPSS